MQSRVNLVFRKILRLFQILKAVLFAEKHFCKFNGLVFLFFFGSTVKNYKNYKNCLHFGASVL